MGGLGDLHEVGHPRGVEHRPDLHSGERDRCDRCCGAGLEGVRLAVAHEAEPSGALHQVLVAADQRLEAEPALDPGEEGARPVEQVMGGLVAVGGEGDVEQVRIRVRRREAGQPVLVEHPATGAPGQVPEVLHVGQMRELPAGLEVFHPVTVAVRVVRRHG